MSELIHQLRNSGAVDPQQLEAAFRRQQIYGGSLDTVLLELELLTPERVDELLALACGLPPVPGHMFEPREREWDRLPRELVDLGWVMPLGTFVGRMHVAVHPELSDEKLAQLRRDVPGVVPMVTAECCLARLASERTHSVVPQRYAILAASYVATLRRRSEAAAAAASSAPAPAPWMTAPASAPAPEAAPPPPSASSTVETTQSMPRFNPPPRTEDAPVPREAERTQAIFQPPPIRNPAVNQPVPEPPPYQRNGVRPRTESSLPTISEILGSPEPTMAGGQTLDTETAPTSPAPPTMSGAAHLSAEPIAAALTEQFAEARAEIESARERDAVTDALLRAAMLISPRVALFGVKREGLRGLAGPGAVPGVTDAVVPVTPLLERALATGGVLDRVVDLDLRLAVEQESAVPCLLTTVTVRGRPVLILYVDRDGRGFSEDDLLRARELCDVASASLEEVLKSMAAQRSPVTRGGAANASAPPPVSASTPTRKGSRTKTQPAIEMPALLGAKERTPSPSQPRLPHLVEAGLPRRFNTLVGQGPPSPELTPDEPPAAAFEHAQTLPGLEPSPSDSHVRTLPGLESPPGDKQTLPGLERSPLAPPAAHADWSPPPALEAKPQPITLTSSPPPPASEPAAPARAPASEARPAPAAEPDEARGITPLSTPLVGMTTRGRLQFEDEEETEVKEAPAADSMEARIDACLQSAMGGGASVRELMQFGERALIRIAGRFPGPIDVFRRDLDSLPPPSAHGPLIRLTIQIGAAIVPHLLELMDHRSPNVRFYAAFVFQALRDDRCVTALSEHAFDADGDVRAIAMRVLETYSRSPEYAAAMTRVRRDLESDNRTRQLQATRAVGTLRDRQAVARLIELLASDDRYIQEAALESLCSITGQQLGLKPQRWRKWFEENGSHHRVEWIMSSLQHRDVAVRRWAADELRRITGQDIDFPAAAEQPLRDAALRRWMEWWHNAGRWNG